MASLQESRAALDELASRLHGYDAEERKKNVPDRILALTLLDHDYTFKGRLHEGHLIDIDEDIPEKADVRLVMTSDDLIALTNGELNFAHAWATGKIRLDASIRDLLRLRSMM